ncbi:two-component sensor histidine kinase KinC [Clostridium sediminicola]|uniref:two-component system sensor histidine kinase NtrB n=1 Tax=Clostridium sediminicola TaxID=3114879 RepID=UPI0031F216E4
MYYSDVSCNVENTLMKIEQLKIRSFLSIDWMGIVTVSNRNRIIIDGSMDFNNIGSSTIIKLLTKIKKDMLQLQEGKKYEISQNENLLVSPIRVQDNYKVFYVCCSIEKKYNEKDVTILDFIMKVLYENVLLNDEKIEERNYLYNIFNSIESSIISIDLKGIITAANKSTFDVFGFIPNVLIGQKYNIMLTEEEEKVVVDRIRSVVKYNKVCNAKNRIFTKHIYGEKYVDLVYCPLNDNKGQVVGITQIARDVTKLKIYERQLEQLKQFAILGEVATGIAHDIRNPLMSIRGCTNILKKSLFKEPKYMEFLEPIIVEVDRINEVVEQMLSYATMTKESSNTLLNINEILEKCLNVIRLHKGIKYINIEKNLSKDLPLIKGSNIQLQQAFINILMNAIQAIENEGNININSYYLKKKEQIVVAISDDGIGISSKKIEKILTPFYSTKEKGIGFGLSIAKRAIDKQGGEIKVNSELNKGTTFEVYLPIREE